MKNTFKMSQEQFDSYKKQGNVVTADGISVFEFKDIPPKSKDVVIRAFTAIPVPKEAVPIVQNYILGCSKRSLKTFGQKPPAGYLLIVFDPQGNSYPLLLPKDEIELELKEMNVDPTRATDEQLLRGMFKFTRDTTGIAFG